MYILLNTERMAFMHAHPDPNVLCELAHIESAGEAFWIFPLDKTASAFKFLTNMELTTLVSSFAGDDPVPSERAELQRQCWHHAHKLAPTDVDKFQLSVQAHMVSEENTQPYRYVFGSNRPAILQSLDEYIAAETQRNVDAHSRPLPEGVPDKPERASPLWAAPEATLAATPAPRPQTAPAPRVASASATPPAPRGGNKRIIWETADEMWEADGKPTDKAAVLALRKRIMDVVEPMGIKRTSASCELGNWHKTRAPF